MRRELSRSGRSKVLNGPPVAVGNGPSNYPQFVPVAQLYLKVGEIDKQFTGTIIERMLQGEKRPAKLVNGVSNRIRSWWLANVGSHSLVATRHGTCEIR
jgi:hypothetical protein